MKTRLFQWSEEGGGEVAFDVVGQGRDALLLPALSSISSRSEMHPLAERLAADFRCRILDWPGFGMRPHSGPPATELTPALLLAFLRAFATREMRSPAIAVAAGHGAAYLAKVAAEFPQTFAHLVLVAPTWRGPLPTAMGNNRRPLWSKLRRLIEAPIVGPALFRLNVSRPVMHRMMRAHVYSDPSFIGTEMMARKMSITRRRGARFATAAFVTGGLDLVTEQKDFLDLFAPPALPRTLVLIGASSPPKSRADMDVLAALAQIRFEIIPGALAAHEEHPQAVADAVLRFTRTAG